MRLAALVLLAVGLSSVANAQEPQAWSAAEIARLMSALPDRPPTNREFLTESHYAMKVARVENRNGPVEVHRTEDRVFVVLHGSATLRVGGMPIAPRETGTGELQAAESRGYREVATSPGAVLSVPRGVPYQIVSVGSKVEFLVVRVF